LSVWINFLQDPEVWYPIAPRPMHPPLCRMEFTSDAAGFSADFECKSKIGVGCIGLDESGCISFATQVFWPKAFKKALDSKGKSFGNKTTTLEMIGLILPFLLCPNLVKGKHIVLRVDNIGCYYGWNSKAITGDETASIFVRSLLVLSAYLCCYVHVEHLPRMSSWEARVCDNLSRESTTSISDKKLVDSFGYKCPTILLEWLEKPKEDWDLVIKLLNLVENKC